MCRFAGLIRVMDLRVAGCGGVGNPSTPATNFSIVVAIAPPALPFVLAPPPSAEIDREDDDDQGRDEDYNSGQLDHSDGVTGAGLNPRSPHEKPQKRDYLNCT